MDKSDEARDMLIEKLEEVDWDMSEDGLDVVAHELEEYFPTYDIAREFVESNASSLFEMMEEITKERYKGH